MKQLAILIVLSLSVFHLNAQSNGTSVFDDTFVHEIRLTFTQTNYWDSLEYYYADFLDNDAPKQYMVASVEFDGTVIDSVGVRQKGYYSNWGSDGLKEPLKINFKTYRDDQRYDGLKKVNLQNGFKDPTMMRDVVAYKFMRDAGIPAPRTAFAKVYLNDTYWGLYIMVEQVDNRFLKLWFDDNDGNLFKCIDNTSMNWQGTSPLLYQDEFELKTNSEANDWSGFIDLMGKVNTAAEFRDSIDTRFKIHNYLKVLAADVLMYNWDSYYDHGRNFYLYQDSLTEMFHWIPWDYNLAFSNSPTNIFITYSGPWAESKPLVVNVMADDWYRSLYYNNMCIMLEETFNLTYLEPFIDANKNLISSALADDPNKFYTMNDFNTNFNGDVTITDQWGFQEVIKGLKPFISGRYNTVHSQFNQHNHTCSALGIDDVEQQLISKAYPNPSTGLYTIEHDGNPVELRVYDQNGRLLIREAVNQSVSYLDLSGYSAGIYRLNILGEASVQHINLVKY